MKLKYTGDATRNIGIVLTGKGKEDLNLTVKPLDEIEVSNLIGEKLLSTGKFSKVKKIEIKEIKKNTKIRKEEGVIFNDNSKGI